MDEKTAVRKRTASVLPRDSFGQFSSAGKNKPKQSGVSASLKISTPPLKPESANLKPDAPLVSISIDNPFKRLMRWLDEIRKKQITELNLKLKLPLAVTLSITAMSFGIVTTTNYFYNWGKYIGLAQARAETNTVTISRIGKIMSTQSRYLFAQENGDVYIISSKSPIDPSLFLGRKVLLTGNLYAETNTILPSSANGIEIIE